MEVNVANVLKEVSEQESKFKTTIVKKPLDLSIDEGNLLATDTNLIESKRIKSKKDKYLYDLNRDNVQVLINRLWELPVERVEDAVVATLPEPTTEIPREKPLPKPKKETKWEAYAKLKGIQNRKKQRMIWDETHKEYRPSWGYKRANDETKQWLIEVPSTADPYEDQFGKRIEAKKERIAKNELQRLKNIARNHKGKVPGVGLTPVDKPDKEHLGKALSIAKTSTASAGKFTKALPKEDKVKQKGKKRKFEPNSQDISKEKERQLDVLSSITGKKAKLNVNVAMKQTRMEEQKTRRVQKQSEEFGNPMSKKTAKKAALILQGKKRGPGKGGKRKRGKK